MDKIYLCILNDHTSYLLFTKNTGTANQLIQTTMEFSIILSLFVLNKINSKSLLCNAMNVHL